MVAINKSSAITNGFNTQVLQELNTSTTHITTPTATLSAKELDREVRKVLGEAEAPNPEEPPKSDFDKALSKDNKDLLLLAALLDGGGTDNAKKLLETVDANGDTAILRAIRSKQFDKAAVLAFCGADLTANDAKGLTAPFLAASVQDLVTAGVFAEEKYAPTLMDRWWKEPIEVLNEINQHVDSQVDDKLVDKVAAKLCGCKPSVFIDGETLQKHYTHVKGMSENPGGTDPEGWWFGRFLQMRIRTLTEVALHTQKSGGDTKQTKISVQLMAREIAVELETLRTMRRCMAMLKLVIKSAERAKDDKIDAKAIMPFIALEAKSIVMRALSLPKGLELNLPAGWPGHAIYLGIEKRRVIEQDVLTLRIDNHGQGSNRHGSPTPTTVKPYVINIPMKKLAKGELIQDLVEIFVKQLLSRVGFAASSKPHETFYDELDALKGQLLMECGPVVTERLPADEIATQVQTTGNCVVASHNAGFLRRMSETLGKSVMDYEFESSLKRFRDSINGGNIQVALANTQKHSATFLEFITEIDALDKKRKALVEEFRKKTEKEGPLDHGEKEQEKAA